MKKTHKILLLSGTALVLGAGSVSAYLRAQPKEQLSDLTLANLEAMAAFPTRPDGHLPNEDDTENVGGGAGSGTGSGGGSSCTVSIGCSVATPNDYISCSGTSCQRNNKERWVRCNGNTTYCDK